jgi:hypothetical protein
MSKVIMAPTKTQGVHPVKVGIVTLFIGYAGAAHSIDLMPEDAIAPPSGIRALQLRVVDMHYRGSYANGVQVDRNARLSVQGVALRYTHATQLFNRPSVIYADIPYGEVKSQLSGTQNAGKTIGDISFAFAHWLLNDRSRQEFAGVVGYLTLPTGEYDPKYTTGFVNTNLGQNRYAFALQAGYSARLFDSLTWLVAVDSVWFGKNDDFRPDVDSVHLEQRRLLTLQNHLSRRLTPEWMVGLGHIWTTNGEWVVDGVGLGNRQNIHRLQLASTYDLPGNVRVGLQLGRALRTQNGLLEQREITFRIWRFF